jgi:uncharacterized protein (TIGR02246 family)
MRTGIAVVCAALAAAGAVRAEAEARTATAADEKAVSKIATDWTDAWNRHDAAALAGAFSEHGDMINPMGDVAKGHDQVLKLFQREQAGKLKESKMALTCEPTRFFGADVAEVDCDFALEGVTEPHAPALLRGHLTNVVVRDGARWSIVSLRAMVPRPMGPPPKTAAAMPR